MVETRLFNYVAAPPAVGRMWQKVILYSLVKPKIVLELMFLSSLNNPGLDQANLLAICAFLQDSAPSFRTGTRVKQ